MMDALSVVKFSELHNWSVLYLTTKEIEYNHKYSLYPIGSFLTKSEDSITIQNELKYTQVTVHTANGGLEARDKTPKLGKDIGTKRQYRIHEGQFLVSKIDARNGAFGIVPSTLENAIVTHDFPVFNVDKSKLNTDFLLLITTTEHFKKVAQDCSSGTTNRQRIDLKKFLAQRIPVPEKSQQDEIVSRYYQTIAEAKAKEAEVLHLEHEIEQYLLSELNIDLTQKGGKSCGKSLHIVNYKTISKWGYDYLSNGNRPVLESKRYKNIQLFKLMDINPATSISSLKEDEDISFVPMESVSDIYGELVEPHIVKTKQSKGYTKFQDGDLIWARITPCMQNGKSAILKDLRNGFGCGSTEFHVLRRFSCEISTEYVYCLLRTKHVLDDAKKYFTGSAGQQRVPKTYLQQLSIPLPPIDIQNTIVTHIFAIKDQIKLLKQQSTGLRAKALIDFEKEIFE